MSTIKELQAKIAKLEAELANEKSKNEGPVREKISQMSSEVVDSNPYRQEIITIFIDHNCK